MSDKKLLNEDELDDVVGGRKALMKEMIVTEDNNPSELIPPSIISDGLGKKSLRSLKAIYGSVEDDYTLKQDMKVNLGDDSLLKSDKNNI